MLAGLALQNRTPPEWFDDQNVFRFLVDDPQFVYSRPCFSPSGDRVLYMRAPATDNPSTAANSNRSPWTLWTVPTEGGEQRLLFDDPVIIPTRPDWSAVSNRIALTGMTAEGASVWILDPETGKVEPVAIADRYSGSLYYPTWYPDGERIAVTDYSSHTLLEVWPDQGRARPLTDPSRIWVGMASVAPEPQPLPRVAFAGQRPRDSYSVANNRIWIRQPDGTLHLLDAAHGRTPWWSPTGDRLAFSGVRTTAHPSPVISPRMFPPTNVRIYVQRVGPAGAAAGSPRVVSPPDHASIHPKWHPSGGLIACTTQSLVSGRRGVAVLSTS